VGWGPGPVEHESSGVHRALMAVWCTAVVSPTSFVVSWVPSPLRSDTRLLISASRMFPPPDVLDARARALSAGAFVSDPTNFPPCGRANWLLFSTEPGAAGPVELISAYSTRMRVPYPGQQLVLYWRECVNGDCGPAQWFLATVGV
jgi:hypothetical protein